MELIMERNNLKEITDGSMKMPEKEPRRNMWKYDIHSCIECECLDTVCVTISKTKMSSRLLPRVSCISLYIVILFGVCGLPWFFPFKVSTLISCVLVFVFFYFFVAT